MKVTFTLLEAGHGRMASIAARISSISIELGETPLLTHGVLKKGNNVLHSALE